MKSKKFYFTYGCDDERQPYNGGWTVVEAEDVHEAIRLFKRVHPNPENPDVLNCCSVFTESMFKSTYMYKRGNFGKREHEVLKVEGKK